MGRRHAHPAERPAHEIQRETESAADLQRPPDPPRVHLEQGLDHDVDPGSLLDVELEGGRVVGSVPPVPLAPS